MLAVSVVIPCYNGAAYLAEAIASARAQAHAPAEIIVVDDGSTDDSVRIARESGATVLEGKGNGGPARSRNLGLRAAASPLVAFLDADDRWLPNHLALVLPILERLPAVMAVSSGHRIFGTMNLEVPGTLPRGTAHDLSLELLRNNHILQSATVVRRDAVLAAGAYDETRRYAEDYDLWLRLSLDHPFAITGQVTVEYRTHPDQTITRTLAMFGGAWQARREHLDRLKMRRPTDVSRAEECLREAWERDLDEAWRDRDHSVLPGVLALEPPVPGAAAIAARWRRREALHRPFWRAAAWLFDRAPASLQAWARSRRSASEPAA